LKSLSQAAASRSALTVPLFLRLTTPSRHFSETANIFPDHSLQRSTHMAPCRFPPHLCLALQEAAGSKPIYGYCETELCFM